MDQPGSEGYEKEVEKIFLDLFKSTVVFYGRGESTESTLIEGFELPKSVLTFVSDGLNDLEVFPILKFRP